jgi:hypothetical protein
LPIGFGNNLNIKDFIEQVPQCLTRTNVNLDIRIASCSESLISILLANYHEPSFYCGLGLELANLVASHKIMIEIVLRFAKKQ